MERALIRKALERRRLPAHGGATFPYAARSRIMMAESGTIGGKTVAQATALSGLERAVASALAALLQQQRADGHWVFELEADATIPAEYILLQHYLDEIDTGVQQALARYLRAIQGEHGGWPLFHGGALDLSASVKAYFALKAVGDAPDAPHMARARAASSPSAPGAARSPSATNSSPSSDGTETNAAAA